jgi:hypothetical protein
MKVIKLNEASEDHYLVDWEVADFEAVFFRFKDTMKAAEQSVKKGWISEEEIDGYIKDFEKGANTLKKIKRDKSI